MFHVKHVGTIKVWRRRGLPGGGVAVVSIGSFLATRPAGSGSRPRRGGLDTLVPRYSTGGIGDGSGGGLDTLVPRYSTDGRLATESASDAVLPRQLRASEGEWGWGGIEWKTLFTGSRKGECFT